MVNLSEVQYSTFVYLWAVLGTPDVGSAEPEHLSGSVVEAGEWQLGTVPGGPGIVGTVRFFDPPVVSNILPLEIVFNLINPEPINSTKLPC